MARGTDTGLELFEHQREGIPWLRDRPRALLADEPGLGKTAQLLLSAAEPVLVVAPAMVLDSGTWDDEIEKFAPGIDLTQVAYTSLCEREKTSRFGSRPLPRPRPELLERQYRTLICDESHYLKGRNTSWTLAMQILQKRAAALKLSTGTPIPNWAHEAFTQLQLMYPQKARPGSELGSYWRWAKKWFEVGPTAWSPMAVGDKKEDVSWEEFYAGTWGDLMLLRLRDDCLDLPPLTITPWKVKMGAAQRKAYREIKRDFITWLESGVQVEAWSSAGQLVKLMKAATGLEVLDPEVKGSGKLDALRTILSDRPRPTLVVGHFRDTVAACARVAEQVDRSVLVVDGGASRGRRREAVRAFQSGGLDVLCATIDTVREGMNLHSGGADQVIRVERSARPSSNEQVIRRLHRIGQDRPVQVIDLITEDTVDQRILKLLAEKTDQQMRALGLAPFRELA